jgi:hypothetical protein
MNALSICFVARRDLESKPGGDTVQCHMYEKTAQDAGCKTEIWLDDRTLPAADIYHAFNIDRPLEIYPKLRIVKRSGKPFIISTIHHPNAWIVRFRREHPPNGVLGRLLYRSVFGNSVPCSESIKEAVRLVQQGRFMKWNHLFPSWTSRVQWILEEADAIMLLSSEEAKYLEADFRYRGNSSKMIVLPNWVEGIQRNKINVLGIDGQFSEPPVILVGRVETRKNFLRVAYLADRLSRPMLIIGRPNPNEPSYSSELKTMVAKSRFVKWIPGVPREQMADYYANARFLLNASYAEVSPLVDIEALSFGCPLATTHYALHHEFLPAHTPRCDSYSNKSISELLGWRPKRLNPADVIDSEKCRENLLSVYGNLERKAA